MPKISQLPVQTNVNINPGDSIAIVDSFTAETKQLPMAQLDLRYTGVPNGGTTQQVLAKASGTNKDVYWRSLDRTSVGLGQVDNTSDANKPISNATQSALNLKANTSALVAKADIIYVNNGLATKQDKLPLGADGEVLTLVSGVPAWAPSGGGPGAVTSVYGRTGNVTAQVGDYDKTQVGLDQVDNTSDLDKPISNLTQTALNTKATTSGLTAGLATKQDTLPAGSNGQILKLVSGLPAWVDNLPSVTTGIAAFAGGGQASATQLLSNINQVATVATALDSVKLPTAVAGLEVLVINDGANKMNVFPATGGFIDGLAVNVPFELEAGSNIKFVCAVAGKWKTQGGSGGGGIIYFGTLQVLANAATISLLGKTAEKVKLVSTGGAVTVTLPNGTINNQVVYVLGTSDVDYPTILNSGNVVSNGDKVFTAGILIGYMWDATDSKWYQIGGI